METIRLKTTIDEKRRIMIDLPEEVPLGEVELEMNIHSLEANDAEAPPAIITREWARAKLKAAGLLAEYEYFPEAEELSDEEETRLGLLLAGDRPVEDYVNEDREERF